MIPFFLILFSAVILLLYPVSIKDDEYSPPRDNAELSLICANQVLAQARALNSFANPDDYCSKIITKQCADAGFTIQECYAVYFVDPAVKLPDTIVESINKKIHGP